MHSERRSAAESAVSHQPSAVSAEQELHDSAERKPPKVVQPTFLQSGCFLSTGARLIQEKLKSWYYVSKRKGREYVFPRQMDLATELGVTKRTIQRWLDELEANGYIRRRKTLNGNRYYFLDPEETLVQVTPMSPAEVTPMSPAEVTPMSPAEVTPMSPAEVTPMSPAEVTPMSPAIQVNNNLRQSAAAAAETKAAGAADWSEEKRRAVAGLLRLQFSPPLADRYSADPPLTLCVLEWLPWRLTHGERVRNVVRFTRRIIDEAEHLGFWRDEGHWRMPPGEGPTRATELPQTVRRELAAERESAREDAARDLERWLAVPEAERVSVIERVAAKNPFLAAHIRRGRVADPGVVRACLSECGGVRNDHSARSPP